MAPENLSNSKAKQYSHLKYSLIILETIYLLIILLIFLGSGLSRFLEEKLLEFGVSPLGLLPLYLLIILVIYYVISFPLNFYHSYILEHKFSLSTQNIYGWIFDQFKAGIIAYIISIILMSAFYYILAHYPNNWWLVISLVWILFSLLLAKLTPILIIPLFFKYKRLTPGALRDRIINLAEKMKILLLDVFEIDSSKKTLKGNAALVGVGGSRRVILADTLKDKYNYDEIEIIIAHEFAHYKYRHLVKLILFNSLMTVILFYLIFKSNNYILGIFGLFSLSTVAALPLIFIYFILFGIITQPLGNFLSRKLERNADILALSTTGLKEAFISMLDKLAIQNLADRKPHPLIKFFFFDHPPIDERINLAR
jgi:STE24 endopeptidase